MRDIDRRYRLVATAPNALDVVELLKAVIDQTADIREKLSEKPGEVESTTEARTAAIVILTRVVDRLRQIGNNGVQRSTALSDEHS